jgi:hypothetical protein
VGDGCPNEKECQLMELLHILVLSRISHDARIEHCVVPIELGSIVVQATKPLTSQHQQVVHLPSDLSAIQHRHLLDGHRHQIASCGDVEQLSYNFGVDVEIHVRKASVFEKLLELTVKGENLSHS